MDELLMQTKESWSKLRGRTYDFLAVLRQEDLTKKLPFPESQSLYYQLDCMLGTTETIAEYIQTGSLGKWHCSLPNGVPDQPLEKITKHLHKSDEVLFNTLDKAKLLSKQQDNTSPLQKWTTLVEHESHHHGQLINFIYALNLPIPKSWEKIWELHR
jgi:hypothetical protein